MHGWAGARLTTLLNVSEFYNPKGNQNYFTPLGMRNLTFRMQVLWWVPAFLDANGT